MTTEPTTDLMAALKRSLEDAATPAADHDCPDSGRCWHGCPAGACWRVHHCAPLSLHAKAWTPEERAAWADPDAAPPVTENMLGRGLAAASREDELTEVATYAPMVAVQDVNTDDRVDPQTGEVVNLSELARIVADHAAAVKRERELRAQAAEAEATLVRVMGPTDVVDGPGYTVSLFTGKRGKRQVNAHAVQEIRDRLVDLGLIEAREEVVYGSLTIADLDRADVQAKLRRAEIDPAGLELERRDTTTVSIVWD